MRIRFIAVRSCCFSQRPKLFPRFEFDLQQLGFRDSARQLLQLHHHNTAVRIPFWYRMLRVQTSVQSASPNRMSTSVSPRSETPPSPKASPRALPAASQSSEQSSNPLRLDPIIEHVATEHHHLRQTSAGTVSFIGSSRAPEKHMPTKSRRPSKIKAASPPPAMYVCCCLSALTVSSAR